MTKTKAESLTYQKRNICWKTSMAKNSNVVLVLKKFTKNSQSLKYQNWSCKRSESLLRSTRQCCTPHLHYSWAWKNTLWVNLFGRNKLLFARRFAVESTWQWKKSLGKSSINNKESKKFSSASMHGLSLLSFFLGFMCLYMCVLSRQGSGKRQHRPSTHHADTGWERLFVLFPSMWSNRSHINYFVLSFLRRRGSKTTKPEVSAPESGCVYEHVLWSAVLCYVAALLLSVICNLY